MYIIHVHVHVYIHVQCIYTCTYYRIAGKFGDLANLREIAKFTNIKRRIVTQCAYVRLAKCKIRQKVLVSDSPKLMLAKFSLYTVLHIHCTCVQILRNIP